MKTLILLFIAAGLLNARATSFPGGPEVGDVAPTLKLSTWLQAPPEAALGWPTGKVVVLEFWSTSCGPCVAYIPHLNELADEFKDKPVQFIAVTDDPESVVKRFLKKTSYNSWIGVGPDAGQGDNTPYRVWSLPHTVVIDAHGRVAAVTNPFMLSAPVIQSCLDGLLGTPALAQRWDTNRVRVWEGNLTADGGQFPGDIPDQYKLGIRPSFQVMIQPTNSTAVQRKRTRNPLGFDNPVEYLLPGQALTLEGVPLNRAIEVVFGVQPSHIVAETKLPKGKYDFYITLPPINGQPRTQAALEDVFAGAVAATFGVTVKRETRDVDVLVLKTNAMSGDALSRSINHDGKNGACWNEAAAIHQPLSMLAQELEISSAMRVFDETGLTKPCDFDIKWEQKDYAHPNIAGMIAAAKQLGLDLVPAKKSLEVILVSRSN
ncbi:MAG TPA: TIGR03435 family protein [Verrucomicrobiae bacterium]|nr:TIGR03435 family protein [Verrucomicrobiae bacterium]